MTNTRLRALGVICQQYLADIEIRERHRFLALCDQLFQSGKYSVFHRAALVAAFHLVPIQMRTMHSAIVVALGRIGETFQTVVSKRLVSFRLNCCSFKSECSNF